MTKMTETNSTSKNTLEIVFMNAFVMYGADHFIDRAINPINGKKGMFYFSVAGTEFKTKTRKEAREIINNEYKRIQAKYQMV